MSLWSRSAKPVQAEKRFGLDEFASMVLGGQGVSGVDGGQIDNAAQSIAVSAAVDLIASVCSELPFDNYTGDGPTRRKIRTPGYLEDPAGDGTGVQDWLYQVIYSWLYRGNMYGEIQARDGRGDAGWLTQVSLFHPDKVSASLDKGKALWSVNGQDYTNRMLHRRVNPVPGALKGQSPITRAATTIGLDLATTRFGKGFFDADANPVGILRNNLTGINPEQGRSVKQTFMAALRGSREPIVMGRGWEFSQLTVNPEESQFLGTMGYTEAQCARIFGPGIAEILGYETAGGMTYANVQDRDIQLLKYAVGKWIRRLERVLFLFLPKPQYVIFNRDALLETNTLARYQAYASALGGAPWKLVNEVREKESLEPLPEPEPAPAPEPPADDEDDQDEESE